MERDSDREVNGEDIYALDSTGVEKAYEVFLKDNVSDMKFRHRDHPVGNNAAVLRDGDIRSAGPYIPLEG